MTWQTIRTLAAQAPEGSAPLAAVFVAHPQAAQYSTVAGRIPYAEIGFASLVLSGSPTAVTLAVWRLSDGTVERLLTTTIPAAEIASPIPLDVEVDAEALFVTVDSFTGGTAPTLDGVIRYRPSRSGASRPVPGLTALPSGASTAALQTTGNASLASVDTKLSSQATAAKQDTGNASLASVDTKLSSQATAANQATEIASLGSIDGKLPAAAAPSDAAANAENTTSIRSRLIGFNGTTWDRIRAGVTALGTSVVGWLNVIPGYVYNASPTTRTEGQYGAAQADLAGNQLVSLGTDVAGEDRTNNRLRTYLPNGYTHLAANATTTIKSGAGTLRSITINAKGATANTITVYDNTAGSGTVIAVIDTTAQLGTFTFDVQFATGLTVVIATGTAADVTVSSF